jgi:MFS family permease
MIYGWLFAIFSAGSALGPYVLGVTFEAYRSYAPALIGFGVLLVIASALILCLGPYRYPVTREQEAAKPMVAVPQPT